MSAHVNMDLNKFQKVVKGNDYYKVRYSVPGTKTDGSKTTFNFSECKTLNGYIIGRMDGDPKFKNEGGF